MEGERVVPTSSHGGEQLTGMERLKRLLDYSARRYDPNTELPAVPAELTEWAQDTVVAGLAGTLVGGVRQWREERAAGPVQPPAAAATKAHAARAVAEEQTQRLARIANGAVRGAARIGGLAAVFYAGQTLSGIYRGRRDFYDTAFGGMAAGTVLGASLRSTSPAMRVRSVILGAALGACVGLPAGFLQDKLVGFMPEEQQRVRRERLAQTEAIISGAQLPPEERSAAVVASRNYDGAAVVIAQLEASLQRSPTQQAQQQQQEAEPKPSSEAHSRWRLWR